VRDFYLNAYFVPPAIYSKYESVFFKLIMNTVKDLTKFGITPNTQIDKAMDGIFRQNPSKENLRHILTNEVIRGLWDNKWGGRVISYSESRLLKKVMESVS
jgi:hypothetical protein